MTALFFYNGRLIDPSQHRDSAGSLLVRDGRVAAIDPADQAVPEDATRVDLQGKILAPGLVDLGTELREPGREEDETIRTGAAAALAGGYTTLLAAANTDPPIDTPAGVEFVRQKAAEANGPRVEVIACVSRGRQGEQMAELGLLAQAGAVAFSDSPRAVDNAALLRRALAYCRMFNKPIFDRPEVPELVGSGIMHEGEISLVLGLPGIPAEAEDLAVNRDLRLAEATSGRLHVGPVSTAGSVELLRRAKQRGSEVTASATPQHLTLTDENLRSFDAKFKVHPPLRSREHLDACRAAVVDGTIDCLVTGHTPRAREKKMNDLQQAPFGMVNLETAFALSATELVHTGLIGWSDLLLRMSTRPAEIAGVTAGTLRVGSPADLVVIDPDETWTVDVRAFRSQSVNTPLEGRQLRGRIAMTVVGGVVKYQR